MRKSLQTTLLFVLILLFNQCANDYDIVIRGGSIYDGTMEEPYIADIGIRGDKIIKIGNIRSSGDRTIDATDLAVAPGFIDIHTHCDRAFNKPGLLAAENYLSQGVTTVVTGNCGGGTYDVEETFNRLDSTGFGPNVVHLVGHNTIRRAVMGMEDREPTGDELDEMKALARKAMEGGAAGFSTGLFYAPGSYAQTDEVIEIAKLVHQYGGIYATHMRDESSYSIGLLGALKEALKVGEEVGIPLQISHIKALGKPVWGLSDEVVTIIEDARSRGVKVMADQYPYPATSTSLTAAVVPRWVQANGELKKNLRDPEKLPGIKEEIDYNVDLRGGPEAIVVVTFAENHDFDGKSIKEISNIMSLPVAETVTYLCLQGSPSVVTFSINEDDLNYFMKRDWVMTGSDGSVPVSKKSKIHPRSYGAFTRKLRKYVREDGVISMEHAIRAATSLPASMLGLKDRGVLKEGNIADIVVFDPVNIRDEATFDDPQQHSSGIPYLLVNGRIVRENSIFNGELAGKALRMNNKIEQ